MFRIRSTLLVGWLAAAAALWAAMPGYAQPSNDEITNPAVVTALPYSNASTLVDATRSATDPADCGAGPTIWYTFTPTASQALVADVSGSEFWTVVGVYTGTPDALTQIDCSSKVKFEAEAGTTYHFMVTAPYEGAPVGATLFTLAQLPSPVTSVTLVVDRTGTVDRQGMVTIHGTVACDQPGTFGSYGEITQANRRFISRASGSPGDLSCGSTPYAWSLSFSSQTSTPFIPGRVSVSINGYAYNDGNIDSVQISQTTTVVLRGTR